MVFYLKPVPAIGEPAGNKQGEIVWIWPVPIGTQPTEYDVQYNARVPEGTGAVFAYFSLN